MTLIRLIAICLALFAMPVFALNPPVGACGEALGNQREISIKQFEQNFPLKYLKHLKDDPAYTRELDSLGRNIQRVFNRDISGGRRSLLEFIRAKWTTRSFSLNGRENLERVALYGAQIEAGEIANISVKKVSDQVGYGVFAESLIEQGQMVGEYTGVQRQAKAGDRKNAYLFNTPSAGLIIDAMNEGNETRFINHSYSSPNLQPIGIFFKNRWHVILIANRNIATGEQLLLDYGPSYWLTRGIPEDL